MLKQISTMFFIKTFKELRNLRNEVKQLTAEMAEQKKVHAMVLDNIEKSGTMRIMHVNTKMYAQDLLKRALTRTVEIEKGKVIRMCLVSESELRMIANEKIC